MLSDPRDAAFIFEMHQCLREIAERIDGETPDQFLGDMNKPHALAMSFLMLGEAANRVSRETRAIYPDIPWQKLANLRHLIAHEYRKIDHSELWRIATTDAPTLAGMLPKLSPPEDTF